jgi:hypothetical protein
LVGVSRSNARQAGKVTEDWLAMIELALERAMGDLGAERERLPPRERRAVVGTKNPAPTEVEAGEGVLRAGDRTRTGDVQLGKLAFYH